MASRQRIINCLVSRCAASSDEGHSDETQKRGDESRGLGGKERGSKERKWDRGAIIIITAGGTEKKLRL